MCMCVYACVVCVSVCMCVHVCVCACVCSVRVLCVCWWERGRGFGGLDFRVFRRSNEHSPSLGGPVIGYKDYHNYSITQRHYQLKLLQK